MVKRPHHIIQSDDAVFTQKVMVLSLLGEIIKTYLYIENNGIPKEGTRDNG